MRASVLGIAVAAAAGTVLDVGVEMCECGRCERLVRSTVA
jgi:hypothetical protein